MDGKESDLRSNSTKLNLNTINTCLEQIQKQIFLLEYKKLTNNNLTKVIEDHEISGRSIHGPTGVNYTNFSTVQIIRPVTLAIILKPLRYKDRREALLS